MPPESFSSFLADTGRHAKHWLFDSALPLWWERGADHKGGGFHEKLGQDGQAIGKPVRVRVQARQTYVYARAGALGWTGPWQAAMRHGLSFMLSRYPRPDGLFRSTLDTTDESIDLYDQAFVLFALAHTYEAEGRPRELLDTAQVLLRQIEATLAHGDGGYYDGLPHQPVLKSNPLMHLLEALLAWVSTGVEGDFRAAAVALCELATTRLVHPDNRANRAVGELFTTGWAPLGTPQERAYEPGHQFEWAYLLLQAESLLGINARSEAIALENFGRSFGIDSRRQVALFAVDEAGKPTDRRARLWAQTERLRTSLLFATQGLGDAASCRDAVAGSFSGLMRFLATDVPGLWHEWQREDGAFDIAPSPASSLYHLMTGLESLLTPPPLTPAAHRAGTVERTITA